MEVIVQQLKGKLFLWKAGEWTSVREQAKGFRTALEAICFCILNGSKEVRLVSRNAQGEDRYLYPFGGDPAVKRELKQLRKSVRESRQIKADRRMIKSRIDMLVAESKEEKKRIPFKRARLGESTGGDIDGEPEQPRGPGEMLK